MLACTATSRRHNCCYRRERESTPSPKVLITRGTGLHYAALNGHRRMVEFLVGQGADVSVKDTKVGSAPAGWAEHDGHPEIKDYLEQIAGGNPGTSVI